MSGLSRAAFEKLLVAAGGKAGDRVTKATSLLVVSRPLGEVVFFWGGGTSGALGAGAHLQGTCMWLLYGVLLCLPE